MKEVKVYSKEAFDNACKRMHLNDNNVETEAYNCAFVCVHNSSGMNPYFHSDHSNVLNLFFDDWTPEEVNKLSKKLQSELVLFNEDMSEQLKTFFERNKNAEVWHVHCVARVSRSGAVALWLANKLGLNVMSLVRRFGLDPNMYVLKLLRK